MGYADASDYSCPIHGKKFWIEESGYCTKCYETAMANPVVRCVKHDPENWVESFPVGAGYCRACVLEKYEAAPECPYCRIKKGFAPGTGDCGCDPDPT